MAERILDAAIIGGGPAGGTVAAAVARAGFSVAVIEEHGKVGEPVQCAGLVSPRSLEEAGVKAVVLDRLSGADFHSPSGTVLAIGSPDARALVIDRAAFDRAIMDRALDAGAVLHAGRRAAGIARDRDWVIGAGGMQIRARLLVGADGPRSAVREALGLPGPEFMLSGFQADVAGLDIPADRALIFTGREAAPNFFAWAIPAGDVARVGLCVRDCRGTAHAHFRRLFEHGPSAAMLKGGKVLATYAGMIPLGPLHRTAADAAMLVGDAAAQVKATSGGGIYPGQVCARRCAEAAVAALSSGDLSARGLQAYHDAWRGDIGDELDKAMMMHRVYASLDDAQLDDVFAMLAKPDMLDIINRAGDIDYPSRLAWLLLRKEPGLLRYAGKVLRHGILKW